MKWALGVAAACGIGIAAGASGDEILVAKSTVLSVVPKVSVDLSELRAGSGGEPASFVATVQQDLFRSGWLVPGQPGDAAFRVKGTCESAGRGVRAGIQVVNRGTSQEVLDQVFVQSDGRTRRLAHQAADAILFAITGKKGIAQCQLVMVGAGGKGKDLFLCDADGSSVRALTKDGAICMAPSWSPDGSRVVYTSYKQGFPDIYLIELGSGRRTRIAGFPGLNMAGDISPDGRDMALVLSKDGNPELYIMNLETKRLTRLTHTKGAGEASPSWSPDGTRIVYVSDAAGPGSPQLFIIGRVGGSKQLTTRGSENVAPDWGANGAIVYTSRRGGRYAVVVYDPATGENPVVTQDSGSYEDPCWAPDGRHVFCSRTDGGRGDIYLLDILGDPPIRLTRDGGNWRSPACTP